eukprot:4696064-Prymnesium_polylepis.2
MRTGSRTWVVFRGSADCTLRSPARHTPHGHAMARTPLKKGHGDWNAGSSMAVVFGVPGSRGVKRGIWTNEQGGRRGALQGAKWQFWA